MKKLFQLSPMLEMNAYHTLKIIGPYRLEHFENDACRFMHGQFSVALKGEKIEIEVLQDEQVLIEIQGFQGMTIKKVDVDD